MATLCQKIDNFYPLVGAAEMPSGPKYFSGRPHSKLLEPQLPGSKWPCKRNYFLSQGFKLLLLQERPNSPKEVEKYKVDDCVDHTNDHIEHADKEIVIGIVNVAAA